MARKDTQENLLAIGSPIGEYRIEELLGEGSLGTVYRAVHPVIGRTVAIKVLAQPLANDPAVCAQFEREARLVNESTHPNLVNIFGYGMLPDRRPYYVMELLRGRTLAEVLAEAGRLREDVALPIFRDVARALAAMHAQGVVHRDLKSENVLLAEDCELLRTKLLDFGMEKPLDRVDPDLIRSRSGKPHGTALYMSPEQCQGKALDARSDLYALGVLMFETLAGSPPFVAQTFGELLGAHVSGPIPRLSDHVREVRPAVADLVAMLLAKSPDDRPQSADEVVARLETMIEATAAPRDAPPTVEDPTPIPGPVPPGIEDTAARRALDLPHEAAPGGRRSTGETLAVKTVAPVRVRSVRPAFLDGEGFLAADTGGPARLVAAAIVLLVCVLGAALRWTP